MKDDSNLILAAALAYARGENTGQPCPVFPCRADNKSPHTKNGFKDATINEEDIRAWWRKWPDAMIGVPTGKVSGFFVVDQDLKPGGGNGPATWDQWCKDNRREVALTRVHTTPSGGRHALYRYSPDVEIRSISLGVLGPGIEIKGEGGYVIVPPSVMSDKKQYTASEITEISEPPNWLLDLILRYRDRDAKRPKKDGRYTPASEDELRAALNVHTSDCDYHRWLYTLAGIYNERGKDGRELAEEWSAKSTKYDPTTFNEKWPREVSKLTEHTAGSIYYWATEKDPNWRARFDKIVLPSGEFVAGFVPPDYLVDGFLQRRYVYSLTAPTGSGKTCIALLGAAHVALGLPLGNREVERGRVLYFAGENPDDVRSRWIKLCEEMKQDPGNMDVYFLSGSPPIGNDEIRKRINAKAVEYGPFSLVIVDTSAAYFQGDDENSNAQLGAHARMLRSFVDLPGGPTILVTCHPTKNPDMTNLVPRGGGAFLAEMDGNLVCLRERNSPLVEIDTHGKFRGPEFAPFAFKLLEGTSDKLRDRKGRLIKTVFAVPMSERERTSIETAGNEKQDQMLMLLKFRAGVGLSLTQMATELKWTMTDGQPSKRQAQQTIDRLKKENLVELRRGHYELTGKGMKVAAEAEAAHKAAQGDMGF